MSRNIEQIDRDLTQVITNFRSLVVDGSTRLISVSANYTVPDAGYDLIVDVTTMASEISITIGTAAANLGRKLTIVKNISSGIGEVKIVGAINGYTNIYLGLAGQYVDIKAFAAWTKIGGNIQPVALEPPLGMPKLLNYDATDRTILNGVPGVAAWTAKDISALVPPGTKAILANVSPRCAPAGAGAVICGWAFDSKNTAVPAFNKNPFAAVEYYATGATGVITSAWVDKIISINASRVFYYYLTNYTNATLGALYMILLGYF
jgi:hypothetical protein